MTQIDRALRKPIIGALKAVSEVDEAIDRGLDTVVLLHGTIFDVVTLVERAREDGLFTLIHIDLVEGIGRDAPGMRYLAQKVGVGGIITTKARLVREARDAGLLGILRLFLLDSQAYSTGIDLLKSCNPDAVEMLPGLVLPHLAEQIQRDIHHPIIAGGLIRTPKEARSALEAGAMAISTSRKELWSLRR